MQETHVKGSSYFVHNGFLVILSGSEGDQRCYAGVGFLVAPWLRHSVAGFLQKSDRIASLRLRVPGGQVCFVTAYAPTDVPAHTFEERQNFFHDLSDFASSQRTHGPTFVLGDFNARLHYKQSGEERIVGSAVFGNPRKVLDGSSNRELLLELCQTLEGVLANTCFDKASDELVTYRNLGIDPGAAVCHQSHAQIDFVIVPRLWFSCLTDVYSDRMFALQSQHYILLVELCLQIDRTPRRQQENKADLLMLKQPYLRQRFCQEFLSKAGEALQSTSPDVVAGAVQGAMHVAAEYLPSRSLSPHRPWITSATLELIEDRNFARQRGHYEDERKLHKLIRQSAKKDRKAWLDNVLENADWAAVRALRKGPSSKPGRLRNLDGQLVSSDVRAETLAEYLEKVQWSVQVASAVPAAPDGANLCDSTLPIRVTPFTLNELLVVVKRLKAKKAPGNDNIPMEFWKALCSDIDAVSVLLHVCNVCWECKCLPSSWEHATVVTLFKKGDTSLPSNYR